MTCSRTPWRKPCASHLSWRTNSMIWSRPSGLPIKTVADWMLASQWAINASVHNSLLTLFRDNFPAGAFSLLRPVFETLVRVHLIAMGDRQVIEEMCTDRFRIKFFTHPEKVDNHFHLGGDFKSLYLRIMNFMHSAVHMGMEQMKRAVQGRRLGAKLLGAGNHRPDRNVHNC